MRGPTLWCRSAPVVLAALSLALPPGSAAEPAKGESARSVAGDEVRSTFRPERDPLFRHQWNLRAIQVPRAWDISRGAGATVAVLDTGVAYESRGRYRRAPDLAGTRFVAGWDFVDGDSHPNDVPPAGGLRSHGTHMAALIAQTAGNGIGGAGVAPAAAIMPIRVLKPDRTGSARDIARGLRFAADHGADVANLSIAGPSPAPALKDAIDYATRKGVTVVAAAGNDGRSSVSWPAAYPDVIAVGAVNRQLSRASYSSYGRALDVVAPGGAGELLDNGYGPGDGVVAQTLKGGASKFCFCFMASTSAAAAQVSGVAALLVGSGGGLTDADVRRRLLEGARDLGESGRDSEHGAGLVQARRALSAATAAPAEAADPPWATLSIAALGVTALAALLLLARRRRRRAA